MTTRKHEVFPYTSWRRKYLLHSWTSPFDHKKRTHPETLNVAPIIRKMGRLDFDFAKRLDVLLLKRPINTTREYTGRAEYLWSEASNIRRHLILGSSPESASDVAEQRTPSDATEFLHRLLPVASFTLHHGQSVNYICHIRIQRHMLGVVLVLI